MEPDHDEIVASFDARAAMALLLPHVKKEKSGRIVGSPSDGNVCTLHVVVNDEMRTHAAASASTLRHDEWTRRIPKLLREEFKDAKIYIIAWTLSNKRFYNLKPGDVFLDTRKEPKYAVVPSRRAKTVRRVRRQKKTLHA